MTYIRQRGKGFECTVYKKLMAKHNEFQKLEFLQKNKHLSQPLSLKY